MFLISWGTLLAMLPFGWSSVVSLSLPAVVRSFLVGSSIFLVMAEDHRYTDGYADLPQTIRSVDSPDPSLVSDGKVSEISVCDCDLITYNTIVLIFNPLVHACALHWSVMWLGTSKEACGSISSIQEEDERAEEGAGLKKRCLSVAERWIGRSKPN